MDSMAEEILRDILLKLPTRDVIRCSRVSRQWRRLVTDSSFVDHHSKAAHVISGSDVVEALLVYQTSAPGKSLDTMVFSFSSTPTKPMCHVTDLANGYRPTSICNGFIVLSSTVLLSPVFVLNPITGEKVYVPPLQSESSEDLFAMGYSPSDRQHKLFHVFFPGRWPTRMRVDVLTLGGEGGWRPRFLPYTEVCWSRSPPTLLGDNLYVVIEQDQRRSAGPDRMLVIDVATEAHCMYLLPEYRVSCLSTKMVNTFELRGQLGVAIHILDFDKPNAELRIWVALAPKQKLQLRLEHQDSKQPCCWEPLYNFSSGPKVHYSLDKPRGVWLDGKGMLCCIMGDGFYKYDTTNDDKHTKKKMKEVRGRFFKWDHHLRVPSPPPGGNGKWTIFGGYRPTLLSPRDITAQQDDNIRDHEYKHGFLSALQYHS